MGAKASRIPTFMVAATREELRSLFLLVNIKTGHVNDYKVMRNEKEDVYEAWFFTFEEMIPSIDKLVLEFKERNRRTK